MMRYLAGFLNKQRADELENSNETIKSFALTVQCVCQQETNEQLTIY